jgi:hypothetical protein
MRSLRWLGLQAKMIRMHRSLFSRQSRRTLNSRMPESQLTATAASMVLAFRHLRQSNQLQCVIN